LAMDTAETDGADDQMVDADDDEGEWVGLE
jgi:hypothetical protein